MSAVEQLANVSTYVALLVTLQNHNTCKYESMPCRSAGRFSEGIVRRIHLRAMPCLLHECSSFAAQCMYAHVVVHLFPEVSSLSCGLGWRGEDLTVQCMQAGQVDSCVGGIVAQASHWACTPVRITQQQPLQTWQAGQKPHLQAKAC